MAALCSNLLQNIGFYAAVDDLPANEQKWKTQTSKQVTLNRIQGFHPSLHKILDYCNEDAMYTIGAAIGAMTAAWALYTLWTDRAAIAQGILTIAEYWPLALIGALAAAITYLVLKYDNWRRSLLILSQI